MEKFAAKMIDAIYFSDIKQAKASFGNHEVLEHRSVEKFAFSVKFEPVNKMNIYQ